MINIIIPIVENAQDFAKFVESKNNKEFKFFIGIKQSLSEEFSVKAKNVEIHKYKDNSKTEEIINSLHGCKLKEGKLLILRRVPTEEEFELLTKSEKDVVTLKARKGKFVTAWKNFMAKIIRKMFSFNYFEDISAVCYGKILFQLTINWVIQINRRIFPLNFQIRQVIHEQMPGKHLNQQRGQRRKLSARTKKRRQNKSLKKRLSLLREKSMSLNRMALSRIRKRSQKAFRRG